MKKEKPSIGKYFKLPNPGLRAYFNHNVSGQPEDYRPPFWNRMDRSKVLELWQAILDASGLKETLPSLYDYEMEMKAKVGPMSIQLPLSERLESIESYYTEIDRPSVPIDPRAIEATKKFFSPAGGIRLRSRFRVIENMRLSTNSGSPFFTKRRLVADEAKFPGKYFIFGRDGRFPNDKFELTQVMPGGQYDLCAVLGWRGQEGGLDESDVKQRVVWMMPFLLNAEELRFYQPAIESIQKHNLIPAYVSMDAVDQEVTKLFDTKGSDDVVICTDFSKFDQHFNRHMQDAAFEIENSLLSDYRDGRNGMPQHLPFFYAKFNIPLVCSEELMYTGPHGMGSGSGGTNFDECMSHKALQFEAAITDNQELNPHSMAYGDDGILTYPGISVEHVIQTYQRHGQEMNETKQYVSKHDCVVLRRWHGDNYRVNGTMVGVYSTFRALGRLLAQERYYDPDKWNNKMVILRALSILENCKWSPVFHEFIDFVISGDKYKLGLAIPGFFDDLENLVKESIDSFTDFLGYTKTLQFKRGGDVYSSKDVGINDWEVVKYLKSKLHKSKK